MHKCFAMDVNMLLNKIITRHKSAQLQFNTWIRRILNCIAGIIQQI